MTIRIAFPTLLLVLLAGCATGRDLRIYKMSDFSGIGAAGEAQTVLGKHRTACLSRVNAAADTSNSTRTRANTWAIILGTTGGLGSGFGIVAATDQSRFGKTTPYVSAGVAAASAILAPFVTSKDEAAKTANEYTILLEEFRKSANVTGKEACDLVMTCAYGHPDFVTPVRKLEVVEQCQ